MLLFSYIIEAKKNWVLSLIGRIFDLHSNGWWFESTSALL